MNVKHGFLFFSHILFQLKLFNLRYLYVSRKYLTFAIAFAELAQLVEHWLPKPRVAGSSPVFRSISPTLFYYCRTSGCYHPGLTQILMKSATWPPSRRLPQTRRLHILIYIYLQVLDTAWRSLFGPRQIVKGSDGLLAAKVDDEQMGEVGASLCLPVG